MALTVSVDEIVHGSPNPLLGVRPHWKRIRLREIASVLNGFAFKSGQFTKGDGMPLIRIRDVGSDSTDTNYVGEFDERYLIEPGDLLVGMDGDFNCARWRGPRGLLNQRVCKVTLQSDQYHPRFLDFALPGYLRAINDATSSVTVKHLSSRTIEDIPLPFPPLHEQQAIVAELEKQFSRLEEAVANLKRVKANLKRYKVAVLADAVEGALAGGREGWRTARLGDIASSVRNGISIKPVGESGTRILRISAVRPMTLDLYDVRYLAQPHDEFEPFRLAAGDVLFTRYNGSVDLVGVCAAVPEPHEPTVYPDKLIRVRVPSEVLLPSFLVIAASTGEARAFIESRIRTTAGQAGVSGADIKAILLRVPPLQEQHRIVAEVDRRLSIVRQIEAAVGASRGHAQALRDSLLQDAFCGSAAARTYEMGVTACLQS